MYIFACMSEDISEMKPKKVVILVVLGELKD